MTAVFVASRHWYVAAICVGLVSVPARSANASPAEIAKARAELTSAYVASLEELARWCDERNLPDQACETRAWSMPRDPQRLYLVVLPEPVGPASLPADTSPDVIEWDKRFRAARNDQADGLFQLARSAIRSSRASLAYELALDAARENPDHEAARRLRGFRQFQGQWHTAYEIDKLRKHNVWHERFGWLPREHIERYEKGERYLEREKRWIPAADDAKRHASISTGWDVETEHYVIRTNHSLEAGVELATRLERLHRVWRQTFVRFYASERDVAQLFRGQGTASRAPRQHRVIYFSNRTEYERALKRYLPAGVQTTGIYLAEQARAYFFADGSEDHSTLYHEATHQLFHESKTPSPAVGRKANFWIIEGIACYMESLASQGGFDTLGGPDAERYQDARVRRIDDDFYVPLAELTALGMEQLQRDSRIARLYTQSAGLTHFLMHYDGGRYRDGLVAYLSTVYSGRDTLQSLAQLTGTGYDILDRQYREFLASDE
ncbi:MAG: hypothetical protein HY000_02825 [Planctomycetes bacterium]|nr:hypothetical protein [Planctomycetota bacterium]